MTPMNARTRQFSVIRRAHGPGAVLAGRGAVLVRVSIVGGVGVTSVPKGSNRPEVINKSKRAVPS